MVFQKLFLQYILLYSWDRTINHISVSMYVVPKLVTHWHSNNNIPTFLFLERYNLAI